jgi:hypothetical protein
VSSAWARAALSHRICTGLPRRKLGELIEELAGPWLAQQESRLRDRHGRDRLRAQGAGPGRELPFTDRVIITLVILWFQLPHAALAVFYRVHRSTITRAVGEIRPLLAARGFAVPGQPGQLGQPGPQLRTLADVFAYAAAGGVRLRIDGTEVQVPRPPAGRPGRRAFVSGKKKQDTIKATAISDGAGRLVWLGAFRPGRLHDVTALRTEGIEDLLRQHPDVTAEVDSCYQGQARDFPAQVSAPPKKSRKDAPPEEAASWEQQRHQQSSQRICIEHAIAESCGYEATRRDGGVTERRHSLPMIMKSPNSLIGAQGRACHVIFSHRAGRLAS